MLTRDNIDRKKNVNGVVPFPLERVFPQSLNQERMYSFQEAIKDFLKRSGESRANIAQVWNWVFLSILGQTQDIILWALNGDKVVSYFILTPQVNWMGQTELFINHGWAHKTVEKHVKRTYLKMIEDDAVKSNISKISFLTQRNPISFKRFLGKNWRQNGVLFEFEKGSEAQNG